MGLCKAGVLPINESPKGLGAKLAALLRGSKSGGTRTLHHVETLPLGPKRSLYLVECDGERFLVAAGGETLSAPVPLAPRLAMQQGPTGQQR